MKALLNSSPGRLSKQSGNADGTNMEFILFTSSLIPQQLVMDRELVERLRLGCSNGVNAADVSRLTTAATKKQKTTARSPWLQKAEAWGAGDLAREWFDQMPRSLRRGSLL